MGERGDDDRVKISRRPERQDPPKQGLNLSRRKDTFSISRRGKE